MARHYVLGSWANADEFDYSGEQLMGHRQGKSICMDHMLPSGMANLKRYGDPVEQKPKAVAKTKSVLSSILLADRNYERLCNLSQQLDDELDSGQITDFEAYCSARKNIDSRLQKAWQRCCKERPELLEPEQYPSQGLGFTLDLEHSRQRQYDYSVIPSKSVFAELNDDNYFKGIYACLLTACKFIGKLWNVANQILTEK